MRGIKIGFLLGSCLLGLVAAQCRQGDGYSDLQVQLVRTGLDGDASGEVRSILSPLLAQLRVAVGGLAPLSAYQLAVDDRPKASFTTDAQGNALVVLGSDDPLDFDPRGREVEVRGGSGDVLRASLSSAGAPTTRSELVELARSPSVASGRATARLRTRKDGSTRFTVEVEGAPAGVYAIFVDGTQRGVLSAPGGFGEVEFGDDDPGSPPLDFAVEDAQIDLALGGAIAFSSALRAGVPDVNRCEPSELLRALPGGPGEAKARFRVRDDCDRDFEVEIEDVPAGAHTLRVGGVARGTITAAFDPVRGRVRGDIEFDTDADEAHELPLDFDPEGQSISVGPGSQIAFSLGAFVAGQGGGTGTCTPEETEQALFAGAAQPLASGSARLRVRDDCRSDLSVEIEDVGAGVYEVVIGGAVRGTIAAAFDAARGQVRGEIEFGDDSPGSPALDFDPRGLPIVIAQAGSVVLSTTFSGGAGGGASCVDGSTSLPLLNVGVDADAHAEARLRVRDDCRETFTVEIEDVAPGDYLLLVGGVQEAVIAVGALGRGEVELDTNDPPKPVLDFDPRGREIAIARGGTVLFARPFPE